MDIIILGAKNPETGRVIAAVEAAGTDDRFVGFLDNNHANLPATVCGLPVLGGFEQLDGLIADGCAFANTITGSTVSRYETSGEVTRRGGRLASLIHPGVTVNGPIGAGAYIQEQVILQAGVEIGENCALNAGGIVSHETILGGSVFLAPGVRIAGEVRIGDGALVGVGAVIAPRLTIGKWSTIGAGAVVIRDVPDYAVVAGNPAAAIKSNERRYDAAVLPGPAQ
ncbi:MAG TPA: NeuD/PglB/VioB family sugar acetyltransferase [Caulobacteraceae bacterium]|nr:NeuD/PglB/VioB family sugar acetyltransferase [Caulobacteraceae bacterium]